MRQMAVGALGTHVKVQKMKSLSTPSAVGRGRSVCSAGRSVGWCVVSAGSGPALGMKSGLVSHVATAPELGGRSEHAITCSVAEKKLQDRKSVV